MLTAHQGVVVQRAGPPAAVHRGHIVDLQLAAWHGAGLDQVLAHCHIHARGQDLAVILWVLTLQVAEVLAAIATDLALVVVHVPVTRAPVQVLTVAIHRAHGLRQYLGAEDLLAF